MLFNEFELENQDRGHLVALTLRAKDVFDALGGTGAVGAGVR